MPAGEIIPDACPAEGDAEIGGVLLQVVDIGAGGYLRIAWEEVSGGVEGIELVFRGEFQDAIQRDAGTTFSDGVVQQLIERIRVQSSLEHGTGGRASSSGTKRQQASALQKLPAMHPFPSPYESTCVLKNRSSAILFFADNRVDKSFISAGGKGLNAFAKRTFSSMCSSFGIPTTADAIGSDKA